METIVPAVHGKDVFVRMAIGSGKTLCMLLPPLATSASAMGVNGLMDEQVNHTILVFYCCEIIT